ncbi:MAG: gamma carbonic anhydrase family protein [Clostridiales bacterium]|nr:gamma carbonic anhydrase family protein [Clostridiales bacterium]
MILKPFRGAAPHLHPTVRAAETAVVTGKVRCDKDVNLWYGAILRGDTDAITVGEGTNVQDGCILHCDTGVPVQVGAGCVLGHGAIVHSCTVGDNSLVGMGATLLSGCIIGKNCIVGAGALVTGNMVVPDGWLVMGVPAKLIRPTTEAEQAHTRANTKEYIALAQASLPMAGEFAPKKL